MVFDGWCFIMFLLPILQQREGDGQNFRTIAGEGRPPEPIGSFGAPPCVDPSFQPGSLQCLAQKKAPTKREKKESSYQMVSGKLW